MDADTLRPIFSAIIGAAFSTWFLRRLAHWIPAAVHGKPAAKLIAENQTRIHTANSLFVLGILSALFMYQEGFFPSNDWRPVALGYGSGCVAAVVFLFLSTFNGGVRRVQEAYVAYAIAQKAPPIVQYGFMFAGFVAFFAAIGSLAGA